MNRGPRFWTTAAIGLALGQGAIAYLAGPEFAFSLVYALPVAAAAWFAGFRWASGVSAVSCIVWLAVEIAQGGDTHLLVGAFNGGRRMAIFLATAYVLAALRRRLDEEATSARTDFLTGLGNARSFHEDAATELDRALRYGHPFTVVYADVDNFKRINDDLGHHQGDIVLRSIANTIRMSLRNVDRVARLGGDEFGILLPETGLAEARVALEKVRQNLKAVSSRDARPVTLTMGALVCTIPPRDVPEMIALSDDALLTGKRQGKDTVRYSIHDAPE
jgi:diguanylate cyclase (GGDEF)-like protein